MRIAMNELEISSAQEKGCLPHSLHLLGKGLRRKELLIVENLPGFFVDFELRVRAHQAAYLAARFQFDEGRVQDSISIASQLMQLLDARAEGSSEVVLKFCVELTAW